MSENKVLARPYAKAAFEYAVDKQQIKEWADMLAVAATIAADKNMQKALADPRIDDKEIIKIFFDIINSISKLEQHQSNFINIVAANQRLEVLPEIYDIFEQLRLAKERRMDVEVITVSPLSPEHKAALGKALEKRFECQVELHNKIEEDLLGGAVIRVGDRIIDGSARGKLNRLSNYILLKGIVWQ